MLRKMLRFSALLYNPFNLAIIAKIFVLLRAL
jgi:hypothetical protein